MPIYQYKATKDGCPKCRDGFEIMQSIKDKSLKSCPHCKKKINKIPARFSGYVPLLSTGNLRDKGFTKLQRKGDGTYEKMT
ncbi:MAG: zinc ribbon domain-containing protein [Planctomycetes bacterium]|nr:zinc ribbon domain-containing protein [Planctomycetota bacterium]